MAKNFREIFAELAPGGKGELVMQKAPPRQAATEGEESQDHSYDRYSGVKVKVRLLFHMLTCIYKALPDNARLSQNEQGLS